MEYIFTILALLISGILAYRFLILGRFYWTGHHQISKTFSKPPNISPLITQTLKDAKFTHIIDSGDAFFAHANATMSSWSEIIRVQYFVKNDEFIVDFRSQCAVPVQLFDWGKNRRIAKRFFAKLEKNLATNTYS